MITHKTSIKIENPLCHAKPVMRDQILVITTEHLPITKNTTKTLIESGMKLTSIPKSTRNRERCLLTESSPSMSHEKLPIRENHLLMIGIKSPSSMRGIFQNLAICHRLSIGPQSEASRRAIEHTTINTRAAGFTNQETRTTAKIAITTTQSPTIAKNYIGAHLPAITTVEIKS
jgi:hypothetical protein